MSGKLIGGRYRLRDLVGQGGYGAVYVADQVGLDRPVALKLLHQQRMDSASRDRFEREARLAQRLEHPNTVRLLDFGCDGLDSPYIAFELLRGTSLAAELKEHGAMPARRVARIASQVLKSLMEAHGLGIVHRDIKPANLFITAHAGEADFCKVLDFGIAKTLESQSKVLTAAGEVVGTPAYMAPEVIAGRPLTPVSDLYSLGLVMAEMLSGSRVLTGDAIRMMQQHLSPEPFALPDVITHGPLSNVVRRATAKDPAQRYSDAAEMLHELEAVRTRLEAASLPPAAIDTTLASTQQAQEPVPTELVATAASVPSTRVWHALASADGTHAARLLRGGALVAVVAAFGIVALIAVGLVVMLLRVEDPPPPLPRAQTATAERSVLPSPPAPVPPPAPTPKAKAAPTGKPSTPSKRCLREVLRPDGIKVMEPAPCPKDVGY